MQFKSRFKFINFTTLIYLGYQMKRICCGVPNFTLNERNTARLSKLTDFVKITKKYKKKVETRPIT